MARALTPGRRARRSLVGLVALVLVLIALNALGVVFAPGSSFGAKAESLVPKLGLDLEGGTQIILKAQPQNGSTVTPDQLTQSVGIIRQRVDAAGVSEAQISTQGSNQIVVSLPGTPSTATVNAVKASALMNFRPVVLSSALTTAQYEKKGAYTPSSSLATTPSIAPTNGSDPNLVSPALNALYKNVRCGSQEAAASEQDRLQPTKPLVTCGTDPTAKYLLGPVAVSGRHISNATAGIESNSQGVSTGQWVVNLSFDATGTKQFAAISKQLFALSSSVPRNQFAIVLDGQVISAPAMNAVISNGQAQISGGSFTETSAKALADQLKFGALPISFQTLSQQSISATLGSASLQAGLLAGLIGLLLVVVYSVVQYRTLAIVTVGSLVTSALLTYLVVDFLSWREGYRLSLAGVAGLIVSIGITADSFIVYFERIRDELREGRALAGAVEAGWRRAIRTVVASDAVNLLAAATLFILAIGDVRGFALTLGLTTIIDVVVVSLFTHPLLQLLSHLPFFAEGHRFSGLDPKALGAVYRGRGSFRAPVAGAQRSRGEAARRQTIAERKAGGTATGLLERPRDDREDRD